MMTRPGALLVCIGLITYLTAIMAESQSGDFVNPKFSTRLYDVLKSTSGNIFYSPYSLQIALAMAYTGAGGNTAKEMQKILSFSEDNEALSKSVKESRAALTSSDKVTLKLANGLFVQNDYCVKETFMNRMTQYFDAEAKSVNFGNKKEAANLINTFVNDKTNGKVKELFSADAFTELTRLVLVNAIYFKGLWQNKFDPNSTRLGEFHLNNKETVNVQFMTITAKFNSLESDELKSTIVELPYHGDYSMVLIVPQEIEGIKHVESKIRDLDLVALLQNTSSTEINLTMPKFKLEHKLDLNEPLMALGIKEMFDSGKANFGGITDKEDLYVSQVVQKAFIEVNEEGSEAAAATGIRFVMRKMPIPPLEVTVRGPFLFFVRCAGGEILFAGRVAKL